MKYVTNEIKIALVAIVGLVVLFLGLKFLKGLDIFTSGTTYYMTFDNISGLSTSSSIYANGFKVGRVRKINYDYTQANDIVVQAEIDDHLRIPKGTTAEIVSDLMGNVKVNLAMSKDISETVSPGGTIPGGVDNGAMGKVKDVVPVVMGLLPKIDSILVSVNALLSDPALAHSLHNVEALTGDLNKSSRELNQLLVSLNGKLPGIMDNAGKTMANAETFTANLNKVDVAATMHRVNAAVENVQAFTEKLNSNNGSLGLLMRDPDLYYNLNSTVKHADSLMIDLKAHPKRYVHFSVFGRKDK